VQETGRPSDDTIISWSKHVWVKLCPKECPSLLEDRPCFLFAVKWGKTAPDINHPVADERFVQVEHCQE
jgi:hypothetical protein